MDGSQQSNAAETRDPNPGTGHYLGLDGWHVVNLKKTAEGNLEFTIAMDNPRAKRCEATDKCKTSKPPRRFGKAIRRIRDVTMYSEFVILKTVRQRYQCRSCKAVTSAVQDSGDLGPDVHPGHRMTKRLIDYLSMHAGGRTFSDVGRTVGVSETTVRRIFAKNRLEPSKEPRIRAPRVLGIDDKYVGGNWYTVFVDLEKKAFVDICEGRDTAKVASFILARMYATEEVEIVCQDMSGSYKEISEKLFPSALIIIDKFHLLMRANTAVTNVSQAIKSQMRKDDKAEFSAVRKAFLVKYPKKRLRDRLNKWLSRYPQLEEVYQAKESFFEFYNAVHINEAEEFYKSWFSRLSNSAREHFNDLITSMSGEFKHYILNYFDQRAMIGGRHITNGFLEGFNGRIQKMSDMGNTYRYTTLRQKLHQTAGYDKLVPRRFVRAKLSQAGKKSAVTKKTQPDLSTRPKKHRARGEMPPPPRGTRQGELDFPKTNK